MSRVAMFDFASGKMKRTTPVRITATLSTPEGLAAVASRTSVTQHGVTFTFDTSYITGQFVDGSWWVIPNSVGGTCRITAVDPAYDGPNLRHGMMVNPSSQTAQSYDGRVSGWTTTALPALPLDLSASSSLVKGVSVAVGAPVGNVAGHPPALQTAVVLTVLATQPAANAFRPAYFGATKRVFLTSQLLQAKLPALAPPAGVAAPALDWITARFARVQLDQVNSWTGRYLHPADNYRATPGTGTISNYGGDMGRDHNAAILRLMLNDATWSQKQVALTSLIQACIDWYGAAKAGAAWSADGGHMVGRKQMVLFGAVLFDDADMKAVAGEASIARYSETGHIHHSEVANRALYGWKSSEAEYWQRLEQNVGRRDLYDPTGQIDGGDVPGGTYQALTTSASYSEAALIARLLPSGRTIWNDEPFFEYVDRWRTTGGAWTLPDTQTARRPSFAALHGTNAGELYRTPFMAAMWTTHRGSGA